MENNHKLPSSFASALVIQSQSGTELHQLKRFVKKSELYHAAKARFVMVKIFYFKSLFLKVSTFEEKLRRREYFQKGRRSLCSCFNQNRTNV